MGGEREVSFQVNDGKGERSDQGESEKVREEAVVDKVIGGNGDGAVLGPSKVVKHISLKDKVLGSAVPPKQTLPKDFIQQKVARLEFLDGDRLKPEFSLIKV